MSEIRKRVVLQRRDGLGIVGVFDPSVHTLRDWVEFGITRNGKQVTIHASLVAVKPRYVLYRESMEHAAKGRLGEFHPHQT